MVVEKWSNGYVIRLRGTNLYITENGGTLGRIGDQSSFAKADRVRLFTAPPPRKVAPKATREILQAMKCCSKELVELVFNTEG